jgi:hypothetical protein
MNTYRIYFFGLICHIGLDDKTKQQALLVRDLDHFPFVAFEVENKIDENLKDAQNVFFQFNNKPSRSDAEPDRAFLRFVPSLHKLLGGALKPELKDSGILVDYPPSEDNYKTVPGQLSVGELYENQGMYLRDSTVLWRKDCVARLIELSIDSNYQELEIFETDRVGIVTRLGVVAPDGCAIIGNVSNDARDVIFPTALPLKDQKSLHEKPSHAAHKKHSHQVLSAQLRDHEHGEHVNKYGMILDDDRPVTFVELEECPGTDCSRFSPHCPWIKDFLEGMRYVITATHLECGNTHWP